MKNKILISDDNIIFNINKHINYKLLSDSDDIIKSISLDILNADELKIEYNIKEEIKINFIINIHENVSFKLLDLKEGLNIKSKYYYILSEDSSLTVNKINNGKNIKEFDQIDLNGNNSNVKYVLKTISKTSEKYDVVINHNAEYTNSNVITHGINIENGSLVVNVTGVAPKGSTGSNVNQINRIINLTKNKCQINPILLIDEMDTSANHSAHISNFIDDELFYLKSRGMNEIDSTKLLIKGLLMDNLMEKSVTYVDKIIKEYWR